MATDIERVVVWVGVALQPYASVFTPHTYYWGSNASLPLYQYTFVVSFSLKYTTVEYKSGGFSRQYCAFGVAESGSSFATVSRQKLLASAV
jgi:hypothetical protein